MNIEAFAFGDEDSYMALQKKLGRDEAMITKMRQVDKSAFVQSDFDKEMFFGGKFNNAGDIDHV